MARLSHYYILSGICLLLLSSIFLNSRLRAQDDTGVNRSEVKTLINGKEYYLHTIKKGETLYSISKAYNLAVGEIIAANPDVHDGLKTNQVLKIPVKTAETQNSNNIEGKKYIYHIVKEGQTIYYLSKSYNIDEKEILKANPELQNNGLQLGQVVKIPKNGEVSENVKKSPQKTSYLNHKIEAKETLYSLSKLYKVSIDDLLIANPSLKTDGLKVGETLLVPQNQDRNSTAKSTIKDTSRTLFTQKDTNQLDVFKVDSNDPSRRCDSLNVICNAGVFRNSEKYNVAVILPFYTDENKRSSAFDTTSMTDDSEDSYHSGSWIYPKSINFIEFYEGLLLAIDSLKKAGLSINLFVYDCGKDTNKIKQILAKKEMQKIDLIIGPVFSEELEIVSRFAKARKINCISPLSNKFNLIGNNPFLFQINPSQESELSRTAMFLETYTNDNILFLYNKDSIYSEQHDVKCLKKHIVTYALAKHKQIDTSKLRELGLNGTYSHSIKNMLRKDEENIIVLPSNNEAFVMDVVSNLNTLLLEYKITLFGLPSWSKIKNVEPEYFFNLKLHYYTPFHINYKDNKIQNFASSYHKTFGSEPFRVATQGFNFSMLGYDVGFYFLSALKNYGKNFQCCIKNIKSTGLLSDYSFERVSKYGGFENSKLQYIIYNRDFTVTKFDSIP
jgi:LysM repeat protein